MTEKSDDNPISPVQRLQGAPRCRATAPSPPVRAAGPQQCVGGACAAFTGLVVGARGWSRASTLGAWRSVARGGQCKTASKFAR